MARSDLLIALVKAGTSGDSSAARNAAEAIIAEERAKRHTVLADRLSSAIQKNGNDQRSYLLTYDGLNGKLDSVTEIDPRKRIDNLILDSKTKLAIDQFVEEQFRAGLLRAHGLEPRNRILLVGPPGTGKTSLAEAIAAELGVRFFVVRYEAVIGSYLGETATRLRRIFEYARTTPCLLFFDEFDAIGKERGDLQETGEIKRVVSSLLMQVDDMPSYAILVAATNHPELLDRASWRRFQVRLKLDLPNQSALANYIEAFSRRFGESTGLTSQAIAKQLGKASFADAEEFCVEVQRRHVLAMGNSTLKEIVRTQLELWRARAPVVRTSDEASVCD